MSMSKREEEGKGRRLSGGGASRVFLRAAADLLPLACLDFTQHSRPFKARTRASGGHRYAPRRVFLAPKYTGTATTTLHRLRRHFPNPESDAPERRCPFWADEKERRRGRRKERKEERKREEERMEGKENEARKGSKKERERRKEERKPEEKRTNVK